jgi:hypothetical protein
MATKKEQDGVEGIPADLADLFLCNFCKSKSSTPLQVDIVRE